LIFKVSPPDCDSMRAKSLARLIRSPLAFQFRGSVWVTGKLRLAKELWIFQRNLAGNWFREFGRIHQ
jgi:hypothetical protein